MSFDPIFQDSRVKSNKKPKPTSREAYLSQDEARGWGKPCEILRFSIFPFADPDVAVVHRIAVVLQRKRQLFGRRLVGRALAVCRGTGKFDMVLDEHAVVQ